MYENFTDEQLKGIPALYAQDGLGEEKTKVYLKVSLRDYIWLITEYNPEEDLFFGFACLGDVEMAELGYISKIELEGIVNEYPVEVEKVDITLKEAKEKWIN
ncbi:DUF2958 domain-containing protein [Poseidonibacter ostreae]|uniref:DUF2958 domain-containing protein n=1 Tax=Poseidonibacter ostreae TaxID=2654171 RepID=A0A6L4WTL1_9BACT|nr:DUF2958 domain-containing protein [Poseidonibacter ostreae]KAB7889575.1 DUF2958 domain-containing protein [Poseidonibacter ostreae]